MDGHRIGCSDQVFHRLGVLRQGPGDAAELEAPDAVDRQNAEGLGRARAMSIGDLREQFRTVSGELRGYLTVVPESRWIKNATNQEFFFGETTELTGGEQIVALPEEDAAAPLNGLSTARPLWRACRRSPAGPHRTQTTALRPRPSAPGRARESACRPCLCRRRTRMRPDRLWS